MSQPISNKPRIESIDVLRGLVMVLMALDHTREYFSNLTFFPTNLEHTNAILFFTRWITNFCAPVFVFLIGTGMFIAMSRGKSRNDTAMFLFTRGIWLLIVELTLIKFAWTFSFDFTVQSLQVIWVTGCAMIVLAGVIYLPRWAILLFGLTLVCGHNLLDGKESLILGSWELLHKETVLVLNWFMPITFYVSYPLIPWIAIPALGYVFGAVFLLSKQQRAKILWGLGISCITLFFVLRYINVYGDPNPWMTQKTETLTIISFFNPTKYPPSLQYLLMTLGPAFLALVLFENINNTLTRILSIFGKVPFFYYFLHLMVIHGLGVIIAYARFGQATNYVGNKLLEFDPNTIAPYGFSLPMVYLIWLCVLIILYPLCKWFAGVKRRNKNNVLLSYV